MKKTLLFSLLFLSSNVFAQTPEQIIQKIYPKYSQQNQCHQVQDGDAGDYCMRPHKREIRDTAQGKLMYLLYKGDRFDFAENREDSAHVFSGLAGFFVLKHQSGNDWALLASAPRESVGSFGYAPEKWTFHEFGKDKWGFLTAHGDVHQGVSGSHYVLFHHNGGRKIGVSWLGESHSNYGYYGDQCEIYADEPKNQKDCVKNTLQSLDSKIKILRDQTPSGGFYPIQITVDGHVGQKKYRQQVYRMNFDAKSGKYIEPKNYVLKDIEY